MWSLIFVAWHTKMSCWSTLHVNGLVKANALELLQSCSKRINHEVFIQTLLSLTTTAHRSLTPTQLPVLHSAWWWGNDKLADGLTSRHFLIFPKVYRDLFTSNITGTHSQRNMHGDWLVSKFAYQIPFYVHKVRYGLHWAHAFKKKSILLISLCTSPVWKFYDETNIESIFHIFDWNMKQ